ncbi:hypothetical protein OKJ48_29375 [Streptomyces kunmingensis]|uniref:Transposase n=2 Tax=Streptomyces kunmingensis TaxID=68225 RepID=A0ABU6CHX7_9ACTN|nr:hypothetical protein [Streptomyces kunmingensis]
MARRGFHALVGVRRDSDGRALLADIKPVVLDTTDQNHIAALVERSDKDPEERTSRA